MTLYDYLDHDDIPLSLAAPCVERVPMVAALEQTVQFAPGPMPAKPGVGDPGGPNRPKTSITYFDVDPNWFKPGVLTTVVAFPFKHGKTRNNNLSGGPFKVQALVRLFLAPPGLNARSPIAAQLRPQNEADWKKEKKEAPFSFNGQNGVFMLSVRSQEVDLTLPNSVQDEADAFCTGGGGSGIVAIPVDFGGLGFPSDLHMLTVKTSQDCNDQGIPVGRRPRPIRSTSVRSSTPTAICRTVRRTFPRRSSTRSRVSRSCLTCAYGCASSTTMAPWTSCPPIRTTMC